MLADYQLLTVSTTITKSAYHELSLARPIASTFPFDQTDSGVPEGEGTMANERSGSRSRGRAEDNTELWFNLPSFDMHLQSEQSAYRTTSSRLSMGSMTSSSSQLPSSVPAFSAAPDINKSLPPPPSETERKSRKQATFRSFLRGRSSSNHLDPSCLQPEPHSHRQRHLSAEAHLSVDIHGHYQQQYCRSMPNSPYEQSHDSTPLYPPPFTRVQSANPASQDTIHYQSYAARQEYPSHVGPLHPPSQVSPTRVRTFPDTTVLSPTARSSVSSKPRPHTWLSPTEPFADPSQFHLFVEATTGLPNDPDLWSPNGPNRLHSSLFARRPSDGPTPVPAQYIPAPIPDRTHQTASWQSFEPPLTSSRSVSAPMSSSLRQETFQPWHPNPTPHMNAVNAELELLGLDEDHSPDDDELPDYAQSQADMNARKRAEAASRARELEARWRGASGRRS